MARSIRDSYVIKEKERTHARLCLGILLKKSVTQCQRLVKLGGLSRAVTNQQLFFNRVVKITSLLERADVYFEEGR